MKTKRWKRRNRHTRPEWVEGYKLIEINNWYYNDWHYLTFYKGDFAISNTCGHKWITFVFDSQLDCIFRSL